MRKTASCVYCDRIQRTSSVTPLKKGTTNVKGRVRENLRFCHKKEAYISIIKIMKTYYISIDTYIKEC